MKKMLIRLLPVVLVAPFLMGTSSICNSTRIELARLRSHSMLFNAIKNRCPKNTDELSEIHHSERKTVYRKDYWGNEYHFEPRRDNDGNDVCSVMSFGPDGKPGGNDDIHFDKCEGTYSTKSCNCNW